MFYGIDVSYAQCEQSPIDWAAAKASLNLSFGIARASSGLSVYTEDDFPRNWAVMRERGLKRGGYHFLMMKDDPTAQAELALKTINPQSGDIVLSVDVEGYSFTDYDGSLDDKENRLATFDRYIEARIGKRVQIYTDPGDWAEYMGNSSAFSGHHLWVANFTTAPAPSLPGGWSTWATWQHSDSGVLLRTDGSTCDVDLNRCPDLSVITI